MNYVEYHIRVSIKGLLQAADMVRHDLVFAMELVDPQTVELAALRYTPERWHSFTVGLPVSAWGEKKLTKAEYEDAMGKAAGFLAGFRAYNTVLGLVGKDEHINYLLPVHIEG